MIQPIMNPRHDRTALDEERWRALESRDRRADGRFVFAVRSTGVYCRPSCPAKRPRRDGVSFFAAPGDAEAAGYRACKRCEPREALAPGARKVEAARRFLDEHLEESVTLVRLGRAVGMSPAHLQRAFKHEVGLSPKQWVAARRAERFRSELRAGTSVTDAVYAAGFSGPSRAYEGAAQRLGMKPSRYRQGGAGETIRWASAPSPVGRILLAATPRGVCRVLLGEDQAALAADLRAEYPRAELVEDSAALRAAARAVASALKSRQALPELPLDVHGTALQERVWQALRSIPRGETRSYSDIAAAIGSPRAVRAVARACARNPVAVLVPCHRVVAKDGSLGGYRWGARRKEKLLAGEK
jgi:AraC family transcriptional regulator of adaptative response/methylated-DNA-[protein]-cysteine methyltransferase